MIEESGFLNPQSSFLTPDFRPVAQLVEYRSPKPRVGGSRPSWPAKKQVGLTGIIRMVDKIKLLVAFLLVVAGIMGFYYLSDSAAVVRLISVLAGVVLATVVAYTSEPGRRFFAFGKDSVAESKRVVLPTRN